MKLELSETEKAELIPHILRVLESGELWENKTMHHPVAAIVSALLEIPGMQRKALDDPDYGIVGFSTIGWDWFWWQDFSYEGKRYSLSGSGYYGGHKFTLED